MTTRILIADDDEVICELFAEVLEKDGYHVDWVRSGKDALARLEGDSYDLLIVDVRMPGMTGLDVTRRARKQFPSVPIVVMTAFGSIETAIEAIREGAFDFVSKPINLDELKRTVARAISRPKLDRSTKDEYEDIGGVHVGAVIGSSPAMVEVYKLVARAAPTSSTVLILGESGTGKELIARAIHQHSTRAGRPFIAVDCGALTDTLLSSELFGHVRGAFTGAVADKKGVFEEAAGGTCFLDEIGDVGPEMQAKLLRVLQAHEVRRVGGRQWIKVNVRIVAATNKKLDELVNKGVYREDLYYRLKVVTISLPPIREHPQDIPRLAAFFLQRYQAHSGKHIEGISSEAMQLLSSYSWPGNIRELENAVERAVVLSSQNILLPEDFPEEIREHHNIQTTAGPVAPPGFSFSDSPSLEEVKRRYVLHVLNQANGNMTEAAKILNVDRRTLYRMLSRYGVEPYT